MERVTPYSAEEGNTNKGVIYGEMLRKPDGKNRPGIQRVFLYEVNRKLFYNLCPTGHSEYRKLTRSFCYHLPAGTYILHTLYWNKKDLYDTVTWSTERIAKGTRMKQINWAMRTGAVNRGTARPSTYDEGEVNNPFTFTIEKGKIHYLGLWDFSNDTLIIIDNKEVLDKMYKKRQEYMFLDFKAAQPSLPQ